MKKINLIIFLILMCYLFSACNNNLFIDGTISSEESSDTSQTEKTIITIGMYNNDNKLSQYIGAFNLENSDYQVQVKYYDYGTPSLQTELLAGKGPDLIPLSGFGIQYLASAGMVEDLWSYLEKSTFLDKDDLNEKVLELYAVEDDLICIPPLFRITSLMGRASELGEEAGWTTEEFLKYVDQHKGCTIFEGRSRGDSREYLVAHYLWAEMDRLVDYTHMQANFNTPEFRSLLEYAKRYESLYDKELEQGVSTVERVRDGKVLLLDNAIGTVDAYLQYRAMLNDDMVVIGEPTASGKPCHGLDGDYAYCINAGSEYKEGAWAFIQYLLLAQQEEERQRVAFPTYLPAFEAEMERAMERKYEYTMASGGGVKVTVPIPTESDIEEIRELVSGVSYISDIGPIESIIYEEVDMYLNEGRDLEQTIEIIQNRVQLFLDEMN